jgi:hypothetical protein
MFSITFPDRSTLIQSVFWQTGGAYDRSVRSFVKPPSRPVREAIASHIIVLAERGVADSTTLCQATLAAFRDAQNERG